MEIRGEDARRLNIKTLSQAARLLRNGAPDLATSSWSGRTDIAGWRQPTACTLRNSRGSWIWACWRGRCKDHQIDMAAGNTTDGLIPALDLFVLEDDRHYFPPYEAVPVIREQTLQQHPEVAQAARRAGGEDFRRGNAAPELCGRRPAPRYVRSRARISQEKKGLVQ